MDKDFVARCTSLMCLNRKLLGKFRAQITKRWSLCDSVNEQSSWNLLSFPLRVVYVSIREPHIWNFEVYKSCYTTWHLLSVFPCCCFISSGGKIARIHWSFEEDQTVLAEGVGKLSDSKQRYINSIEFFTLKAVSLLPLMILHLK